MYSQGDEERAILRLLGYDANPNREPGVLLDIGAADGETFSNSRELLNRLWYGVLVDASPHKHVAMRLKCFGFRMLPVLGFVDFTRREGELVHLHETPDDFVSTGYPEEMNRFPDSPRWEVCVPTVRIAQLVSGIADQIEFVTIDVEGGNVRVLGELLDLLDSMPKLSVICVEPDYETKPPHCGKESEAKIVSMLAARGFTLAHRTSDNIIAYRKC